eukprot:3226931-Lingulodinium_polyedra.AAC.1
MVGAIWPKQRRAEAGLPVVSLLGAAKRLSLRCADSGSGVPINTASIKLSWPRNTCVSVR